MHRFKYVLNNTKVGMAVWSTKDHRLKFINPAFAYIYGYEPSELLGADVRHIFTEEYMQCCSECTNNPSHNCVEDTSFKTIHTKQDGSIVPLSVHITTIKDANGAAKHHIANIINISNHKKADVALAIVPNAHENELLRSIVQNVPGFAFIFTLHADGKEEFLYASDKVLDTYGIDASTLLSDITTLRNLFHPDDMPHFRAAINESAKTLQPFHAEFRINHPQKGVRWLESNSMPTVQADKSIVWHGITMDITSRKDQEEATAQREREFCTMTNNMPDNVARWDTQGRYLSINATLEKTFKMPASEVIGKSIATIVPHHTEVTDALFSVIETKKDAIIRFQVPSNEMGKIETHEVKLIAEKNAQGEIISILGIGRDITEQKQLQENLLLKEFALGNINDAVYLIDENSMFHYVNERACHDLGYSKEELLTMGVIHIDPNMSIAFWREMWNDIEEFRVMTSEHKRKDGTIFPIEISSNSFEYNGMVYGLSIVRDITERKAQEEATAQKEREFRTMTNNMPDNVARWDTQGRYLSINAVHEQTLKMPASEVIGKSIATIVPHHTEVIDALFSMIETKKDAITIFQSLSNEMEKIETHEVKLISEKNTQGEVISILGIGRDITEQKQIKETLTKREQEFRALVERTPDTIARYDKDCIRLYANPAFTTLSGMHAEDIIGIKPTSHHSSQQAIQYEEKIKKVLKTGIEGEFELTWPDKMGRFITSHIRIVPEKDAIGNIFSVLAIGRDITKLKEFEIKLKENEIRLKEAQKIAKIGSWELEFPELKLVISDELYHLLKTDPTTEKLSFDHFLNIVHPDDRIDVEKHFLASIKNNTPFDMIHRVFIRNKKIKYIHSHAKTFYDSLGKPICSIGTVQDITDQKLTEKKIKFLAHHDTLTGLPNRRLVIDRIEQAIACAKRNHTKVALIFIDMDEFKTINDSLGHSIGDSLLKAVASRLQADIRETDTISRQGGDEFLIVLTDIKSAKDVSKIANKLLENFKKPFYIDSHTLSPSISIGIAMYPDDSDNFEMLLRNADTAMYKAKEAGGNDYCFFKEQMNNEITEHLHILNDLKNAIVNNEFLLHYQPQVDLKSHKINGIEALLRWNHPEHGLIPPMKFIPIAESSGLIIPIGEWVAKEACRQAALWCKQGINVTVAINISAVQFKRGNLEETIQKALLESGLAPQYLELELTESILIHDTDKVLKSVQRLKELGIKLSIDDFGTGYSSLAYLKRFAVDKLKIDRSFIKDIFKDQEDAIIVKTIIQMAKSLNLRTVAEGVETKEVLDIIKSHGCDEVQGFYFAKPMCAEDFVSYFSQREFTE